MNKEPIMKRSTKFSKVGLTFDIDWAPEAVIQDVIDLLTEYDVKATFFVTHDSEVLKQCDRKRFELALHPNFNTLLSANAPKSAKEIFDHLYNLYPEAVGVRSHSLLTSSPLLFMMLQNGMKYEANLFVPGQTSIKPFWYSTGMLRIPFHWEDDHHFVMSDDFSLDALPDSDQLYILDFHPVHVYLNTETNERYENAKELYHYPDKLMEHRNLTSGGTRTILIELLKDIKTNSTPTIQLMELLSSSQSSYPNPD